MDLRSSNDLLAAAAAQVEDEGDDFAILFLLSIFYCAPSPV